jgi:hypothetical protein
MAGPPARDVAQMACPSCGHPNRVPLRWSPLPATTGIDPWFGLPLWLQTSCCGELLWAASQTHLAFLERYVSATLRLRAPNHNRSAASRLPKWMKVASNRERIVECLAKLRRSIA